MINRLLILLTFLIFPFHNVYAQDADKIVITSMGSAMYWDDFCVEKGDIKKNEMLKYLLIESINVRYHQSFWEGYFDAKTSQRNGRPLYHDYKNNKWFTMQKLTPGECEKLRNLTLDIVSSRTAKVLQEREKQK